mmetsp:Transcript_12260/g.26282  ORF Transcript_12260/g.26282 Transcript_12260/m.26282 type:complete len:367 (+) Transcript_12260:135-1235(+)
MCDKFLDDLPNNVCMLCRKVVSEDDFNWKYPLCEHIFHAPCILNYNYRRTQCARCRMERRHKTGDRGRETSNLEWEMYGDLINQSVHPTDVQSKVSATLHSNHIVFLNYLEKHMSNFGFHAIVAAPHESHDPAFVPHHFLYFQPGNIRVSVLAKALGFRPRWLCTFRLPQGGYSSCGNMVVGKTKGTATESGAVTFTGGTNYKLHKDDEEATLFAMQMHVALPIGEEESSSEEDRDDMEEYLDDLELKEAEAEAAAAAKAKTTKKRATLGDMLRSYALAEKQKAKEGGKANITAQPKHKVDALVASLRSSLPPLHLDTLHRMLQEPTGGQVLQTLLVARSQAEAEPMVHAPVAVGGDGVSGDLAIC